MVLAVVHAAHPPPICARSRPGGGGRQPFGWSHGLQKRGLTPNDSRALFGLDKDGKPIGVLARELACDPSTATWLVDRLERLGFAERRPSAQDRRVKLVTLTAKGAKSMEELLVEYHRPPPELSVLPPMGASPSLREWLSDQRGPSSGQISTTPCATAQGTSETF